MDDIKDTKKSDQLSRFLGNHIVRTSPFGHNITGDRAYKRAERLIAALHLLTNHIPHDEPLRRIVRNSGLMLLAQVLEIRNEMRIPNSYKGNSLQVSIRELISLVRILAISSFISVQNADLVIEGLDEFGIFLNASQRSSLSENIVISKEDLVGGILPIGKEHPTSRSNRASFVHNTVIGDKTKDIKDSPVKDTLNLSDILSRTGGLSERAQRIIGILRVGGELPIGDIAPNLPEYSEKMIQRELAALVAGQRVKKTGLKRWSKYSLA